MNMSKNYLELLLVNYIAQGIKKDNEKDYWGELLLDLHEDKKFINVHFRYYEVGIENIYEETIEFSLNANSVVGRKQLLDLSNKIKIKSNYITTIINMLKDL